jgi:hypothetical protein
VGGIEPENPNPTCLQPNPLPFKTKPSPPILTSTHPILYHAHLSSRHLCSLCCLNQSLSSASQNFSPHLAQLLINSINFATLSLRMRSFLLHVFLLAIPFPMQQIRCSEHFAVHHPYSFLLIQVIHISDQGREIRESEG